MSLQSGRVSGNPARTTKTYDSLRAVPEGWREPLVYVSPKSIERAVTRALAVGAVSSAILVTVLAGAAGLR